MMPEVHNVAFRGTLPWLLGCLALCLACPCSVASQTRVSMGVCSNQCWKLFVCLSSGLMLWVSHAVTLSEEDPAALQCALCLKRRGDIAGGVMCAIFVLRRPTSDVRHHACCRG